MARLVLAFPQSKTRFTEEALEVWFEALGDMRDEELVKAVEEIIKQETFFPAIATIIGYGDSRSSGLVY